MDQLVPRPALGLRSQLARSQGLRWNLSPGSLLTHLACELALLVADGRVAHLGWAGAARVVHSARWPPGLARHAGARAGPPAEALMEACTSSEWVAQLLEGGSRGGRGVG